ncbi:MAG: VgrG-related protein [Anaerolineaceae bacterium]|nr:VgrG-related protein [Anaerolineaceae bacterium]
MPENNALASQISIKVAGQPVQDDVLSRILAVTVDQHAHLPGMFVIRLTDSDLKLLDEGPFNLAKEIEIAAENEGGQKTVLMKGEITALEPEFAEGMIAELVVRGYDRSHRMFRQTHSKGFINTKDSDLAQQIAQDNGLQAEVETTQTVYEHIFQDNQTDLSFLMARAWRIGYECFVDDGKLYFRKPPGSSAESITLTWGQDLQSFYPRMSLGEQVDEVIVRGWDPSSQQAIVGRASRGNLYPQVGEQKDGAGWAQEFGTGKRAIVNMAVISQAEADALAAARLDELSGAFLEAEGSVLRRPEIKAGRAIKLEALGQRFSGTYYITSVTHRYTSSGLVSNFNVRGTRTGLLTENLVPPQEREQRWFGVVIGVVTNTDDPEDMGRVKVKFPWLSEDVESNWCRVLGIGAGNKAGFYVMPEVGDEVVVSFEHGSISFPVVLGGLWNGNNQIPPEASGTRSGERPKARTWRSLTGHRITILDTSDNKIEVESAAGMQIILDDANKSITLKNEQSTIKMENSKIEIKTAQDVTVESNGNLKIKAGGNIDIQAGGQVTVKGALINLN